jgi:hypothetical protein
MALPAFVIDAPAGPDIRYGLLDAAMGPMPMDKHAIASGAQWWSTACGGAHLYPPQCATPPYPSFTMDAGDGLVQAYSFVVYASEVCTPIGSEYDAAKARVAERFRLGESRAVEQALWGGNGSVTGIFEQINAASAITTLTASTTVEALSLLEQQIAGTSAYNGTVMVHARPRMSAYFAKNGLIRSRVPSDQRDVFSWFGSKLVFGSGYPGNSPTGTAPTGTAETMYGTGRILIWREEGPLFFSPPEVLDRTTNQRGIYAARAYMIGVECDVAAVTVTRT